MLESPQQALHVFFVDDEWDVQMAVQRTLTGAGIQVSVFSSARDCLAALLERTCDAVITDVRMEGMDGLSLLEAIRAHFPWLPVIIVTGYGDVPIAVAALKSGAADFIQKPLDREELLATVRNTLRDRVRPGPALQGGLSSAEARVFRHVLDGRTSREIAALRNRSVRTIEVHRHHIMQKLGTRTLVQLMRRVNTGQCATGPAQREHASV